MRSLRFLACAPMIVLVALVPSRAAAQQTAVLLPLRGAPLEQRVLDEATSSVRRHLESAGLAVRDASPPSEGAQSTAALGALARAEGASYAIDSTLEDFAGMTSLRVRVVSSQDALVGEATDLTSPATLARDASRLLAQALPLAGSTPPPPETPMTEDGLESPWELPTRPAVTEAPQEPERRRRRRRRRPRRREPEFRERSVWLGAMAEPAMGTNRSAFSLMVGGRGEYQWRGLVAGLDLAYTYVIDFEPRNDPEYHTVALFPVLGYLVSLGSPRFRLPIIAAGGWIPGNGGLLRFEAGLAYKPNDRVDLRFIFVCPNFWFLGDRTVLFVSFSFQVLAGI